MPNVSKISETLLRKIRESDQTKAIGAIVMLKSLGQKETDRQKLLSTSKAEMHSFLKRLDELKRGGERITCQPYETLSSAYIQARPDVILKLTDFEEVLEILDNPAVTFIQPVGVPANSCSTAKF
jgi:hypothetical protein